MNVSTKILMNIFGSLIMGLGISLLLSINKGTDTITLFYLGIQQHVPLELWQLALLFNVTIVCLVYFIDRSKLGIGTFINFLLVSFSLKIFPPIVLKWSFLNTSQAGYSLLYVLSAIVIFSIGTGLYAASSLGSAALEALSIALASKTRGSIQLYRIIFDASLVVMALLFGVFPQYATLLNVLLVGPISQRVFFYLKRFHYLKK